MTCRCNFQGYSSGHENGQRMAEASCDGRVMSVGSAEIEVG